MPKLHHKIIVFTIVVIVLGITTASFAVFHNEDGTDTVSFLLVNQDGEKTTHEDLSVKPLLVFFGFTSCIDVCPIGLHKLANVMNKLQLTDQNDDITVVMISVDPERDTADKMNTYLTKFDAGFVGLTGSRVALENAASEFNTFLDKPPIGVNSKPSNETHKDSHEKTKSIQEHTHTTPLPANTTRVLTELEEHRAHKKHDHESDDFIENYQLAHSSVVYLVDTYSRVVTYVSLDDDVETIVSAIRNFLAKQGETHG